MPEPRSLRRLGARQRLLLACAALVTAGGLAPAAEAATTRLTYSCTYPYIEQQPLTLDVTAAPTGATAGVATGPFSVTAVATDGGDFTTLADVVGAARLEATTSLRTRVVGPGVDDAIDVNLTAQATNFPYAMKAWSLAGSYPSRTFVANGTATYAASSMTMYLRLRDDSGASIPLDDAHPDVFPVPCTLVQPTQPTVFASRSVTGGAPDTTAPTKPGTPVASDVTERSVRLTWAASTDAIGVTAYDVYRNGVKVAMTTASTTTVVSGLPVGTTSVFTVRASDQAGNVSVASSPVSATTLAKRAPARLTMACKFPLIDVQAATVWVDGGYASVQRADVFSGASPVKVELVFGDNLSAFMNVLGAPTVEGTGKAEWRTVAPGTVRRSLLPLTMARTTVAPAASTTLTTTATLPSIKFPSPGSGVFTIEAFRLNLIMRDETGAPIPDLSDLSSVPDSDGNPATFDVLCAFNPATQSRVIAPLEIL